MTRSRAGQALAVVTTLLLVLTGLAGYARGEVADREAFSARAASALDDRDVRAAVANRVVNRMADVLPADSLAVRPLILAAVRHLAGTATFRRAVQRAAADAHGQLVSGSGSLTIAVGASSPVVGEALRSVAPRVAAALPDGLRYELLELSPGESVLRGARWVDALAGWFWPLLVALLASVTGLVWACGGLARSAALLGAVAVAAGLTIAAVTTVLGAAVAGSDEPVRQRAREAIWTALLGDLRTAALLVALAGAVTMIATAAVGSRDPLTRLTALAAPLARSSRGAPRGLRAGLVAALGVALVLQPGLVLRLAAIGAGLLLLLIAIRQVWPAEAPGRLQRGPRVATRRVALALAAPAAAALVVGFLVLPSPDDVPAAGTPAGSACNGSPALCAERLNEVVFPSTHNSYSAAEQPGWLFANQTYGISRQLRDGIRGFLLDVHYGYGDPESERVRTDIRAEGSTRSKVAREIGPVALAAADRLSGRVGEPVTGREGVYLCHTLCELGAEPLVQELREIASFLAANLRETLVIVFESYVAVEELERALQQTGLLRQAALLERDEPLPTLGELVEEDRRLVIMGEEDGGARPWFLAGFSFLQDTPLGARTGSELRCDRFRGDADSPILLLNHWIDVLPPSPTRNERVGSRVLRERVERCTRERGIAPGLVAVDFYERTDVIALAAELNP